MGMTSAIVYLKNRLKYQTLILIQFDLLNGVTFQT